LPRVRSAALRAQRMRRRRQWLGPVNDVGTNLTYLHREHHGNIWFLVSFRPPFSYADELVRRPGTIIELG
jgi:hypothetical protein